MRINCSTNEIHHSEGVTSVVHGETPLNCLCVNKMKQTPFVSETTVSLASIFHYLNDRVFICSSRKMYTSGSRYWNVPVLVNTGTFVVYQYYLKMWYLHSVECAGVIQKLTILELEYKNGVVLANTRVPVFGT